MKKLDQEFEDWVKKQHINKCSQCKNEGRGRLMDVDYVTVALFRAFYQEKESRKL